MSTDNKYLIIGAAVAGLALAYMIKKKAQDAADKLGQLAKDAADAAARAAQAINPFNNDNVINQEVTREYQDITGSNGTIGTDLYDLNHNAQTPLPASQINVKGTPTYDGWKQETDASGVPINSGITSSSGWF